MALKNTWVDKVNNQDVVDAEDVNSIARAVMDLEDAGVDGATFTPAVSEEGVLSWTNNKGLENPPPVTIKPIVGVDYFTDADKTGIVSSVLAALPTYNGEVESV